MANDNPEIITIDDKADCVSCDGTTGSGSVLGHPRVFYSFDKHPYAECGYCDRAFVKKSYIKDYKKMLSNKAA